jgi:hypothetical protein
MLMDRHNLTSHMAKGIPASLVYVTGNAPINLEKKKKILNLIPLRVRGFGRWYFQEAVLAQARPLLQWGVDDLYVALPLFVGHELCGAHIPSLSLPLALGTTAQEQKGAPA